MEVKVPERVDPIHLEAAHPEVIEPIAGSDGTFGGAPRRALAHHAPGLEEAAHRWIGRTRRR